MSDLNFIKNANETKEEYLWRIGNLVDAGAYKWRDIANVINSNLGLEEDEYRDESAYRKPYQYAKKFYDNVFCKMIDNKCEDGNYLKELELKKREIESERQKLNATKIEYTRQIRHQSRFELFYENVSKEISKINPPQFEDVEYNTNNYGKEYLLTIADIHAGSNFDINVNKYSYEECTKRFQILLEKTVDYIKKENILSINVVTLGDCIQNILRISDLQLNESSIVEATVFVSKAISCFLNELSRYVKTINYYHCPTANHTQVRPLGTKASELANEDIEYIIGNYIKDVLGDNERITVHTNFKEEYIEFKIHKFNILALHGHQVNKIDSTIKEFSNQNRKFYDYVIMAHYHGSKELVVGESVYNDCEVLIAPSFIGTCPYAKKIMKGSKPACNIYVFDEQYGHTDTHKMLLL